MLDGERKRARQKYWCTIGTNNGKFMSRCDQMRKKNMRRGRIDPLMWWNNKNGREEVGKQHENNLAQYVLLTHQ